MSWGDQPANTITQRHFTMSQALALLEIHGMRSTPTRRRVIDVFLKSRYALTPQEIEGEMPEYDRVTIYRTLLSFLEAGVINRVLGESGQRFHLKKDNSNVHLNFKCNECGYVSTLNAPEIPLTLPQGFTSKNIHLLVVGTCSDCSHEK